MSNCQQSNKLSLWKSFLQRRIIQKFLNKIHMRQQHPPTTVSLQAEGIKGITLSVLGLKKTEVSLPLVPHDLPAGEAPDGDDHCW